MLLTVKQIHSMQNLQRHAPEMKEIQRKFKRDTQKMNEELMKFYKENRINPAASCVPILLQIPVFISLYQVLKHFTSVTNYHAGDNLEWLGLINILDPANVGWGPLLIVIYIGSQLASTYFMSATVDRTQRLIFFALPFLFIPFVIHFKAGPRALLGDDEPLDGRPGRRHAAARPADEGRAAEEELADATARDGEGNGCEGGGARARSPRPPPLRSPHPRSACGGRRSAAPADERRAPSTPSSRPPVRRSARPSGRRCASSSGSIRASTANAVTFEVLAEGERGLLGVGTCARPRARPRGAARRRADERQRRAGRSRPAR